MKTMDVLISVDNSLYTMCGDQYRKWECKDLSNLHFIQLVTEKMKPIHGKHNSKIWRINCIYTNSRRLLWPLLIYSSSYFRCYSGFSCTRWTSYAYDIPTIQDTYSVVIFFFFVKRNYKPLPFVVFSTNITINKNAE